MKWLFGLFFCALIASGCEKDFHFKAENIYLIPDSTEIIYADYFWNSYGFERLIADSKSGGVYKEGMLAGRTGPVVTKRNYSGNFKSLVEMVVIGKNIFRLKTTNNLFDDPYPGHTNYIVADIDIPHGTDTVINGSTAKMNVKFPYNTVKVKWLDKHLLQYEIIAEYHDWFENGYFKIRQKVRIP